MENTEVKTEEAVVVEEVATEEKPQGKKNNI